MKKSDNVNNNISKRSTLTGMLLVLIAALTLETTSLVQYFFSKRAMEEEASNRATTQLESTQNRIMDVLNQAEAAVRNSIWIAQWALDHTDSIPLISGRIVSENPVIVGSTMALVPGAIAKLPTGAPYAFRSADTIAFTSLDTEAYNYPAQEWFVKPLEIGDGYWSEPYVDTGGGEILMTTFSEPIMHIDTGQYAAVLTGDISLEWLSDLIGDIKIYPNAFGLMISRTGKWITNQSMDPARQQVVNGALSAIKDNADFKELERAMRAGESGNIILKANDKKLHVFYAPVEKTGWSMCIVIPRNDIFGGIKRTGFWVTMLQLLGLAMLIFLLRALVRNQFRFKELNERKKVMESELKIASNIQMAMIPKTFPPFPERNDLDMDASIVPAKEIGGDLYDFFMRDGNLYFCIGDVSGKGIPAALVMAVTRSVFRSITTHEDSPKMIVTSMNDSMVDVNENNMFVTFFCGILNLETGHFRYCNAGHNPPMILTDSIRTLPVESNIPLGVLQGYEFIEQEAVLQFDDALFLYTDGLSEAENIEHEQFGVIRIQEALRGRKRSSMHLKTIQAHVDEFVGDAPQSDDLSMLFIHYLGNAGNRPAIRRITLTNKIEEISKIAGFIDEIAADIKLDQSTANKLNLALEEAVTNVVNYAYPDAVGTIDIHAIEKQGLLVFNIIDSGIPFDPTKAPEADTSSSVAERPIGGLGIHLVRTIMDTVQYDYSDGKNILTLTKNI